MLYGQFSLTQILNSQGYVKMLHCCNFPPIYIDYWKFSGTSLFKTIYAIYPAIFMSGATIVPILFAKINCCQFLEMSQDLSCLVNMLSYYSLLKIFVTSITFWSIPLF